MFAGIATQFPKGRFIPADNVGMDSAVSPRRIPDDLARREPAATARKLLELSHAAEHARSLTAPWTPAIRSPIDADKLAAAWTEVQRHIALLPARYAAVAQAAEYAAAAGVIRIGGDATIVYSNAYRRLVDEFVSQGESRLLKGRENEINLILRAPAIALQPALLQAVVNEARDAARDYFLPAVAEAIAQSNWLALVPPPKTVNAVLASRPFRFAGVGIGVDIHRLNTVTYHAGMWSAAAGVWWFNHLHDLADDLAGAEHLGIAPILLIPHVQLAVAAVAALGVPVVLLVRRHLIARRQLSAALAAARSVVRRLRPLISAPRGVHS